jgi:hypothetical protein
MLTDDDLAELEGLRDAARDERRAAAPWEALALGEVVSELPDDELAGAVFTPIDASARSRIAERVLASMSSSAAPPASSRPASAAPFVSPVAEPRGQGRAAIVDRKGAGAQKGARVIPFRKAATVLSPLLVAAGVGFFMLRSGGGIPRYGLSVSQGVEQMRSAPAPSSAPTRLSRATRFEAVARPDAASELTLLARAYVRQGGEVLALRGELSRSSDGSFLLRGRAGELFPAWRPGPAEVLVVIGREGAMPSEAELREGQRERAGVRVLVSPVELLPEP